MHVALVVGRLFSSTGSHVAWAFGAFGCGVRVVLEISFVVVSLLSSLDFQVEHSLAAAGSLENWATADAIAIRSVYQRKSVDDVETVVVELRLGFVLFSQELGSGLHFERL